MRQTVQEMAPLAPPGTQHHAADTPRLHAFYRQVNQRCGELGWGRRSSRRRPTAEPPQVGRLVSGPFWIN